jgi:hypothetical protein
MTHAIRSIGTTVMMAGLTAALLAQGSPKLNVKLGLWEMTSTTTMSGDVPVDTSKMTPEQAAAMKNAMAGMMGPHTSTTKSCMTKEKLDKGILTDQKDCKNTIMSNTATVLEVQMDCTQGNGKTTALMHFEAPTSETVAGTFKGKSVMGTQTMNVSGTVTGKWAGADCGTVK